MDKRYGQRLIRHGVVLFFLGLVVGLFVQAMTNPRMGLASHMQGITNGLFLLALGLIWQYIQLSRRLLTAAFWLALYGAYMNWASTLLAAIFGTSRSTPIAGAGYGGAPWQEALVDFGLFSLTAAMLVLCVLVLWGLRHVGRANPASHQSG